ncbi:MAG: HAD hydrolase family protein [Propioniciclava sp.]
MLPKLIATDLDGTLLASDHVTISLRNRAALTAAVDRGIHLVAVSGRQGYSIAAIVAGTPLERLALCSNGSVGMDLRTGQVHREDLLEVAAQTALADAMVAQFPNLKVTSVRDGGNTYLSEHGYLGDQDPGAGSAAWPVSHRFTDRAEVLASASVKLVMRDPEIPPPVLWEAAHALAVPGCQPTISGAPFLEVARAGVTKASALARFAADLGIASDDVVALGDNVNDVEMLAWAGCGVAMANATPEARAVADEVTASNDADGFAVLVERMLTPFRSGLPAG